MSSEPNKEKSWFSFITKNRGIIEDTFLYLTLVVVLTFSSWFLMKTHFDIEKSQPQPTNQQIFIDILNNKSLETDSNKTDSEKINKNYLAYLQAQANLNKSRYDLGTQLVSANLMRKNIGFLIGTLLALIGCIVIVRRIRNMSVSAEGSAAGQQIKFLTASPGIVLVMLGSLIILTTIIRQDTVSVQDFEPISPFVNTYSGDKKFDEDTKNEVKDDLDELERKIKASSNQVNKNE